MPRFFVPPGTVDGPHARLVGDAAAHLAGPLRARRGEHIVVVDTERHLEHGVVLEQVDRDAVDGRVAWSRTATGEPQLPIHVLQAVTKDGMDEVVEALVEVGASTVRPVLTERTVARPPAARRGQRTRRWNVIARNAAGLAGRAAVPAIHEPLELPAALAALPRGARVLACVPGAAAALASLEIGTPAPLVLCIGPEGGFGPRDLAALAAAGAEPVHLGGRVLRARLAGVVATTLLLAAAGELADPPAPPPA